jgi:hypothetical protein
MVLQMINQFQYFNRNLSGSTTKRYECFRLFVSPSQYKILNNDSRSRLTPQVTGIPKVAAEDTSIVASNIHGEKKTIPILKGTKIVIDTCGIHYNRTYLVF